MRTLIIKTIFNQWDNGLKFLGLEMMDRMRMDLNQNSIPHIHKYEYEEELLEVMKIYFKKRFDIDISASPKQLTKMNELKQSSQVFGATTTKDINALLLTDSLRQNLRTNAFWKVTQQNLRG